MSLLFSDKRAGEDYSVDEILRQTKENEKKALRRRRSPTRTYTHMGRIVLTKETVNAQNY